MLSLQCKQAAVERKQVCKKMTVNGKPRSVAGKSAMRYKWQVYSDRDMIWGKWARAERMMEYDVVHGSTPSFMLCSSRAQSQEQAYENFSLQH